MTTIKVDTSGLDKLRRRLETLAEPHSVPMTELFPVSFMARYTSFSSLNELFEKGGFKVESQEDFQKIPDAEWNQFIAQNTRFSHWEEMLKTAGAEYAKRELGI